jgi:hypothetical protein
MLAAEAGGLSIPFCSQRKEVRTVRRWTLLLAGAALWLFLAAIPALADGGPHVAAINNGTAGLTADGCAGCHRAHTALGGPIGGRGTLLAVDGEVALCQSCHAGGVTGATTDVMNGVQYNVAVDTNGVPIPRGTNVLGALRGGGFAYARINSHDPFRSATENVKVSVLANGEAVTSAHMKLDTAFGNKVTLQNVAWGNGDFSATANAGPTVSISCGTCHNVHGNNNYRILRPQPTADGLAAVPAPGAVVQDGPAKAETIAKTDARNYSVIQTNTAGTRIYLASEVEALALTTPAGDYWHRRVPWTSTSSANDAPNGQTASATGFPFQISTWCSTCHTRYMNTGESGAEDSTDAIFKYRHATSGSRACTTCHVSHGSNALMNGAYSAKAPYPGGSRSGPSSRLLKIDNRGTCQMCHDPATDFEGVGDLGTVPVPTLP